MNGTQMPRPIGQRVLVIEDEAIVAMLLEDMLIDMGYEVVGTVGQFDQAVRAIDDTACDFVILDVNLDGKETYPLADMLAARGVPFIFATGYGALGLKNGWRDFPVLEKPFQQRDLEGAVNRIAQFPWPAST
ncbi:MAG TPA: response regulator [Xanthobacteraceae bacterium]